MENNSYNTSSRDESVWRSWAFMTSLEKILLSITTIFGIVIFCLTIGLLIRDFRISPPPRACSFSIKTDLSENPPIMFFPNSETIIYPERNDYIIPFQHGEKSLLSCPNGKVSIPKRNYSDDFSLLHCNNGDFEIIYDKSDNVQLEIDDLICSERINDTANLSDKSCGLIGSETEFYEIQYSLPQQKNITQIRVCFDKRIYSPLYSSYFISRAIKNYIKGVPRPDFIADSVFKLNIEELYHRDVQRLNINTQLNMSIDNTTYIKNSQDYFLSKGHLAAKGDFIYPIQQNVTFHYINTAPQWQIINSGNWLRVEVFTRNLAAARKTDLVVYSGTFGVCTLENAAGILTEIYLTQTKQIPVPEYFWRVIYDPLYKTGVALVTLNNPFVKSIKPYLLCTPQTEMVSWLWHLDFTTYKFGYTYACDVDELRKNITYIPKLDITDMLY